MTKLSFLYLLFLGLCSSFAEAYVYSKTLLGNDARWDSADLSVYARLEESDYQIALSAIREWDNVSQARISLYHTNSPYLGNGRNEIYFSTSTSYFSASCGVLGVTVLAYDSSGKINEADILLNGNTGCLSRSSGSDNYIGNILTHELGHLFGLAHSEIYGATMYYIAHKGQQTLASDDKAGLRSMYSSSEYGSISGTVIGGDALISIFGANVMAISLFTGAVEGAAISDKNGTFLIQGLPLYSGNLYYLYIEPIKVKSALPDYYLTAQHAFCPSKSSYRGSFFQSCQVSQEGHPVGIELSDVISSVDVGNLTIRCNFDVPNHYFEYKPDSSQNTDLIDSTGGIGNAMTGAFSKKYTYESEVLSYITLEGEDNYVLDLRSLDLSDMASDQEELFLEYRVISQNLYSPLLYDIKINNILQTSSNIDEDGLPFTDRVGRIKLNRNDSNQNIFNFEVLPKNRWGKCSDEVTVPLTTMCSVYGWYNEDYFSRDYRYYDNLYIYFLTFHVSKKKETDSDDWDHYTIVSTKNYKPIVDNSLCPDASGSYITQEYLPEVAVELNKRKNINSDLDLFACGSVALDDENYPPASGLFLVLTMLTLVWGPRFFRRYDFSS